jgi:hypothetical protein
LGDVVVTEATGNAQLNICLSAPSSETVTVQYEAVGGSAIVGEDYNGTVGFITIAPGETCIPLNVQIVNDGIDEPTEIVLFRIFNAQNADIVDEYGVLNIIDGDGLLKVNKSTKTNELTPSITNNGSIVKMQAMPNPFNSSLRLNVAVEKNSRAVVALTDLYGRSIATQQLQLKHGNNQVNFDALGQLKPGNYFICLVIGDKTKVLKLVKVL